MCQNDECQLNTPILRNNMGYYVFYSRASCTLNYFISQNYWFSLRDYCWVYKFALNPKSVYFCESAKIFHFTLVCQFIITILSVCVCVTVVRHKQAHKSEYIRFEEEALRKACTRNFCISRNNWLRLQIPLYWAERIKATQLYVIRSSNLSLVFWIFPSRKSTINFLFKIYMPKHLATLKPSPI